MKSTDEIHQRILSIYSTEFPGRAVSLVDKVLTKWQEEIREDQRKIDAITYSNPEKLIGFDYEQNIENAGKEK